MGAFDKGTRASVGYALAATAGATLLATSAAWALPKAGAQAPNVTLEDAEGRKTELAAFAGKAIVVVYEDKDSAGLNKPLKDELSKLTSQPRYGRLTAVLPLADVSSYDFWPAKGFARDAILEESKKIGVTIYCDWTGTFRKKLGIREGTSSVILLGKDGKVLMAHEGAVPEEKRARFVELIKGQIDG